MTALFCALCVLMPAAVGTDVTAGQFSRIINGLLSSYQDVECMYEGELRRVDGAPSGLNRTFQGHFASRIRDDAIYLLAYRRPFDTSLAMSRRVVALLNQSITGREGSVDQYLWDAPLQSIPGGVGSLDMFETPLRFVLLWYLRSIKDPAQLNYVFQGWERVDGNTCARVQLDLVQGATVSDPPVIRLWLDLARGGHPLRFEQWRGDRLVSRTDQIRLIQVDAGDEKLWFPVAGVSVNADPAKDPDALQVTCSVLSGSLQVNQGLTDDRFSVERREPGWESSPLAAARSDFEAAIRQARSERSEERTDPATRQANLLQSLAEADAQSAQVRASSPSRRWFSPSQVVPALLIGTGGVILSAVFILKRRGA